MPVMNIIEAVRSALQLQMRADPRVIVLGEDIGKFGGVFRATSGLYEEFGGDRVIDTPLAEAAIVGTAIGMAAMGLKPVAEIQFSGEPLAKGALRGGFFAAGGKGGGCGRPFLA